VGSQVVQLSDVTFADPNLIVVASLTKPLPVMVTLVPPPVEPSVGLTLLAVGKYLNRSADVRALVPCDVVTVMSTVPAFSAGETALIVVAELTEKLVALTEPNFTADAPVKFVPVIVTVVPPATGPLGGLILVIVGFGSAS
jgi:hypothetical protein